MLQRIGFIAAALGLFVTSATAASFFSDVPTGHWAYNDIQWANDSGIMTGPGNMPGKFDPGGLVNRAQLATVMARHNRMLATQINDLQVRVDLMQDAMDGNGSSSARSSQRSSVSGDDTFSANLSGSQEVPSVSTNGSGYGWFELESDGDLRYDITVQNLSSGITGAHFHVGAPGVAGSVVEPITFNGNRAIGVWRDMSDSEWRDLLAGRIYVNVHTSTHPDGEIRGQVVLDDTNNNSMGSSMSASSRSMSASSGSSKSGSISSGSSLSNSSNSSTSSNSSNSFSSASFSNSSFSSASFSSF